LFRVDIEEAWYESEDEDEAKYRKVQSCRKLPKNRKSHFSCEKDRFFELNQTTKHYLFKSYKENVDPIQLGNDRKVILKVRPTTLEYEVKH